jgi:glutaredoxin
MSESEHDHKKWRARATERLLTVLNRADELGGELRDYVQDRMAGDPRYATARRAVNRLLGRRDEPAQPTPRPPAPVGKPATAGAPAPTAPGARTEAKTEATAKPKGFGDPSIKAQIYGKRSCPWSGRAITLLERHKIDFDFVDLEEPEHEAKLVPLTGETKQNTVPYVYLRGRFVGGFNALSEIERLGQLDVALMSKEELAVAPPHIRGVEIVSRPNTDEVAPAEAGPPPTES